MTATTQSWLDTPTPNSACAIIAEVAQSHDGSLGMAHAFIDAAAIAGANAIKFQTHIADAESSAQEPWRTNFGYQDESRQDYWRRMEFTAEQWAGLKQHANEIGLHFLSSPFSVQAAEMLQQIGMGIWKIASGEITNLPLLDTILATKQPIILSTGLSDLDEIAASVEYIHANGNPLALLQCTSQYPCKAEYIGLNVIDELRDSFECAVGLSDHSGNIYAGLAAAVHGIQVLEVHISLSRDMFGPDVIASITTQELKSLVEGIRFIETMNKSPVDKSKISAETQSMREIFMQSLVAQCDIAQDEVITDQHLTTKKPGTGIPANKIKQVINKKARRPIEAGMQLNNEDLK